MVTGLSDGTICSLLSITIGAVSFGMKSFCSTVGDKVCGINCGICERMFIGT